MGGKDRETTSRKLTIIQTGQLQTPPYPKRLAIEKLVVSPEFNLEVELKNISVQIPLLQVIKDIPIYAKTVRELCPKRSSKKKKDALTIIYIGHSANALSNPPIEKYEYHGNPIVTISVQGTPIPNTLIDLGAAINIMTLQTIQKLNIPNIRPTPTMLELADRSRVKLEGVLDDEVVILDSWEYPVDFFILQPKSTSRGHPVVLGISWLAIADAFIGCRSGDMFLSRGNLVKQVSLYPLAKSITEV